MTHPSAGSRHSQHTTSSARNNQQTTTNACTALPSNHSLATTGRIIAPDRAQQTPCTHQEYVWPPGADSCSTCQIIPASVHYSPATNGPVNYAAAVNNPCMCQHQCRLLAVRCLRETPELACPIIHLLQLVTPGPATWLQPPIPAAIQTPSVNRVHVNAQPHKR
jgi:hypothetical protein